MDEVDLTAAECKATYQEIRQYIANAATIANIMTEKYANGLPLYRQEAEWNNKGVDFRRNTMANWIIRSVDYSHYNQSNMP